MEDANAIVLDLDEGKEDSNTFFAVYDGHGGKRLLFRVHVSLLTSIPLLFHQGGTVAKFAGENVHKRLVSEETYRSRDYKAALKRAFLGTDEDILAGNLLPRTSLLEFSEAPPDPARATTPSGCTAVAALITHEGTIYVVCLI